MHEHVYDLVACERGDGRGVVLHLQEEDGVNDFENPPLDNRICFHYAPYT